MRRRLRDHLLLNIRVQSELATCAIQVCTYRRIWRVPSAGQYTGGDGTGMWTVWYNALGNMGVVYSYVAHYLVDCRHVRAAFQKAILLPYIGMCALPSRKLQRVLCRYPVPRYKLRVSS